jgi:zinc protease
VNVKRLSLLLLLFAACGLSSRAASAQNSAPVSSQASAPAQANLLRATLPNGMRVVIIRSTLAPVVTVEANFLVGGKSTWPFAAARA